MSPVLKPAFLMGAIATSKQRKLPKAAGARAPCSAQHSAPCCVEAGHALHRMEAVGAEEQGGGAGVGLSGEGGVSGSSGGGGGGGGGGAGGRRQR